MISLTHSSQLPIGYDLSEAPDWFARKAGFAMRLFLNLSPIRYAMVAEEGGPVEKIEYGVAQYLGKEWHLSRATLHEELRHPMAEKLCLFHPADGSGVGSTRLEARSKAVSEALERWAYQETSAGPDAMLYGYPYSMSTKGMAAFPSFLPAQARRNAISEAWEFHSVDAWWAGCLRHWAVKTQDAITVFIDQPLFKGYIALSIRLMRGSRHVAAYGTGSGATLFEASNKAMLEACRSEEVLRARANAPLAEQRYPALVAEQSILTYASPEALQLVLDRIDSDAWLSPIQPKVIFDGPVKGAWNRFAHVWRYALEPVDIIPACGRFLASA
jgi:hypothetical protein